MSDALAERDGPLDLSFAVDARLVVFGPAPKNATGIARNSQPPSRAPIASGEPGPEEIRREHASRPPSRPGCGAIEDFKNRRKAVPTYASSRSTLLKGDPTARPAAHTPAPALSARRHNHIAIPLASDVFNSLLANESRKTQFRSPKTSRLKMRERRTMQAPLGLYSGDSRSAPLRQRSDG